MDIKMNQDILFIISTMIIMGYVSAADCLGFKRKPHNVVGLNGSSVVLRCKGSESEARLGWYKLPAGVEANTEHAYPIADQDRIVDGIENRELYSIINESRHHGHGGYNLRIDLTMATAGTYLCHQLLPFQDRAFADVIVLESDPECMSTSKNGVIHEGDFLNMSCTIKFSEILQNKGWIPEFTWVGPHGHIRGVNDHLQVGVITSSVAMKASAELDGHLYTVRAKFGSYLGDRPSNKDHHTPQYTYSETFPKLHVEHIRKDIRVTPDKTHYHPGEEIVCTGARKVTFQWRNLTDGEVITSHVLKVTTEMVDTLQEWQCFANSTVEGKHYHIDLKVTFQVTECSCVRYTSTTPKGYTSTTPKNDTSYTPKGYTSTTPKGYTSTTPNGYTSTTPKEDAQMQKSGQTSRHGFRQSLAQWLFFALWLLTTTRCDLLLTFAHLKGFV